MSNSTSLAGASAPARLIAAAIDLCKLIPYGLVAFIGRFSIAATFWLSGQTKIQGLAIDIVSGTFEIGMPRLSASAVPLFEHEYQLPLLPPELAAYLAAFAEHLFPILLLVGLATRFSALALLGMTLVIQLLVYPGAYPTHGVWAAVLLMLAAKGPGMLSLDHLIARHYGYNR
ncbi:DoxX family protein [Pseudomonas sp. MBLB4136]|uniref:DoxX family protein n=1 Tax=Pseudomonas sp. MBLB4136 TaxID=3451558 RepID=UPI003F752A38